MKKFQVERVLSATLLRNVRVIGKDYNRMNFPSPRGNLFFITCRMRGKYQQFYTSLRLISIDSLTLRLRDYSRQKDSTLVRLSILTTRIRSY